VTLSGLTAGFLGLGAIGRPMAEQLGAVADLVVHDRRPEACAGFAAVAGSPAELAERCDIVFGCLVDADDYRAAVLGPDGLIRGSRLRHYVHLGTSGRTLVTTLASALAERGIVLLDAPMTGGPPRARAGTLTAMVAGDPAALAIAEPLMRAYASKIVTVGDRPGAAQTMKVINNAVSLCNLAIASEAMLAGAKAGIPATTMLEVLNSGSGQNSATLTKIPDHVLTGGFDYGGSLHIVTKDLQLFIEDAMNLGTGAGLTEAVLQCYRLAAAQGDVHDDVTTVIRPMERACGTELRARKP
jgi:3-hydroxyisobutyrate dehydrogenase-like beta-hydroxyacid dehydrogenase